MNNINVTFTDRWVLWLIIPAVILTVVPLFFIKRKRRYSLKYVSSTILRCIAFALALLLLSGFTVTSRSDLQSVAILVDLSDSTKTVRTGMKDFVNNFAATLDKKTQVALVGFGYNAVTEVRMDYLSAVEDDDGYYYVMEHPAPSASATNIKGALEYAAALLPDKTNKRIVLLSDGLETDGYAELAAKDLALDGIRIDVVPFDSYDPSKNEIQINEVKTEEHAYVGDPITVSVTLMSNVTADVTVKVTDDGVDVEGGEIAASVTPGSNTVSVTFPAGNAGIHSIKAELAAESDSVKENNSMVTFIKVSGDPRILIVDGEGRKDEDLGERLMDITDETTDEEIANWQQAHELVKLLSAVDYDCTVCEAGKLPRTVTALRQYDEIILMNVDTTDLPNKSDELLKEYVSRLGRGLFTTGGGKTYIYGGMEGTPYEEMLPINMKIDEDELPSTALALVIDNSGSMDGQRRNYAKKGAIMSVNALNKKDFASVITFAMDAKVVVPMTSTYDTTEIVEAISKIGGDHQTHLYPALIAAEEQLKEADTETKRVLILSDGEPSRDDRNNYSTVITRLKNQGVTVSTIYLGRRGGGGQSLMERLAKQGGGNFYLVESAADLPKIMLNETLSVDYVNNVTFTPTTENYSQVLSGVTTVPTLDGYISSSSKEHASVVLAYKDDDAGIDRPVYAEWQYGLGRTASFTSDLSGAWSSKWLADENGILFIRNVVSSLLPADNENTSLKTEITPFSRSAEVHIAFADVNEQNDDGKTILDRIKAGEISVEAFATAPGNTSKQETLELTSETIGAWDGSIKLGKEGVYLLDIYQYDLTTGSADPVAHTERAFCVSYSAEYNVFAEKTELMENLAMLTGGAEASTVDDLANVPTVPMEDIINVFTPIAIVIAVLLLADIIIRKVKIKDLKYLWNTITGKNKKKKV